MELSKVLLRIIPARPLTHNLIERVKGELSAAMDGIAIQVEIVDTIPPPSSGKAQYFISSYWRNKHSILNP